MVFSSPDNGKTLSTLTTNSALAEKVSAIVIPFTAKQLGKAAGRTEEAGKAWRQGRACPDLASSINMARDIPAIKWLIYREIERGTPHGVMSPRLLTEAMALLSQIAQSNSEYAAQARAIVEGKS